MLLGRERERQEGQLALSRAPSALALVGEPESARRRCKTTRLNARAGCHLCRARGIESEVQERGPFDGNSRLPRDRRGAAVTVVEQSVHRRGEANSSEAVLAPASTEKGFEVPLDWRSVSGAGGSLRGVPNVAVLEPAGTGPLICGS